MLKVQVKYSWWQYFSWLCFMLGRWVRNALHFLNKYGNGPLTCWQTDILFGPVSDLFVRSELYSLILESEKESFMLVTLKVNVASSSNKENPN